MNRPIFILSKRAVEFIDRQVQAGRTFLLQIYHHDLHKEKQELTKEIEEFMKNPERVIES